MRMCVSVCTRARTPLESRGQVAVIFSCPHVSPGAQTQVSRFGGIHLSLVNHLASLETFSED